MNYECIFADIMYEWSLGIFPTQEEAEKHGAEFKAAAMKHFDGLDDDYEVTIVATENAVRGSIWPSNKNYGSWSKARRKQRKALRSDEIVH